MWYNLSLGYSSLCCCSAANTKWVFKNDGFGALHTEELCKQPINAEYHCKVKINEHTTDKQVG